MPAVYDQSVSERFIAVTPSNSTPLQIRGFHVGVGGDVGATDADGTVVVFKNCIAGLTYGYACRTIRETGTTATNIIGLV